MTKNPIVIFLATVLLLCLLFFVFPINLFDGKIVYQEGLQEVVVDSPLSLSYFIGLGYDELDMKGVKTFYLTTKGIFTAVIFTLGFPVLLAFRIHLKNTRPTK
ncbi:MAG: hypothetical protein P8N52_00835 [Crocinitomicaceae bacterium]|nr:hypothetical protein [Crocinitomicaceae bacterium]MDG1776689.1 hypothetical protein [Crocinitomicaceae bacterium]